MTHKVIRSDHPFIRKRNEALNSMVYWASLKVSISYFFFHLSNLWG